MIISIQNLDHSNLRDSLINNIKLAAEFKFYFSIDPNRDPAKVTTIQHCLQAVATSKKRDTCDPISRMIIMPRPNFTANQHRVFM